MRASGVKSVVLVAAGALAGLLTATMVISGRAVSSAGSGPWLAVVNAASENIDPYVRARYSGSGWLLPTQGEDLLFVAETDADGKTLDGDCTYLISGRPPAVRWWQVAAAGDEAAATDATVPRPDVMTSTRLIGEADGSYRLAVSRTPRPGNWISPADSGDFKLFLTVHPDSALSGPVPLPTIEKRQCD